MTADDAVQVGGPAPDQSTSHIHLPKVPRATLQRLAMPLLTGLGLWILIEQLVGLNAFENGLADIQWDWALVVLIVTQVTTFTEAVALSGAMPIAVPLSRLTLLRGAMDFTGLVGGTVGRTATVVRFDTQRGIDAAVALSSGLIYSFSGFVIQVVFTLVLIPVSLDEFHRTPAGPSGSGAEILQLVLYAIIAAGVIGAIAFMVPRVRRIVVSRVKPQFDSAWANVREVLSSPKRLSLLLAGSAATQLLMAAGLGLSLHAVGAHASLGALILVCTFTSLLGGLAPIPGGIGVMEACYISGLTLLGVPQEQAITATLIYRLCTTYLPPFWGWGAMVWLRRRGEL